MPGTFLFAIILAVFAIAAALAGIPAKRAYAQARERASRDRLSRPSDVPPYPGILAGVAAFLGGLAVILTLVSSFNPVGTREIGIVTSFGELAGHLSPGPNFTAPWDSVTTIDDAYQLTDETFTVRIAGAQTAQATVKVRWNAAVTAADDIFQNYKTTAGVESGLLTPELNAATNSVLDGYDPVAPLATGAAPGTATNPNTTQLGARIQAALVARLGGDVNIKTLVLLPLVYDSTVQHQINNVSAQVGKTDVAQQAEKTAQAQATANKLLEQNLAGNPLVLVQQCMSAWAAGEITVPSGASCWPGSNSGIVIPSASSK
jgi:regulator of protease activity HflC (stomatin/prohibitin superfamily)